METEYKVLQRIGPYDGPYEKGIVTFILLSKNKRVAWHEKKGRKFPFSTGDVITGIALKGENIDYKKSNPKLILKQLNFYANI
jgi:hypothetical protein